MKGAPELLHQPEVCGVEFVESVTDWMEGALVDHDRLALEEHLVICLHCTEYVFQLRLATVVLRDGPAAAEAPPQTARTAILDTFRRHRGGG